MSSVSDAMQTLQSQFCGMLGQRMAALQNQYNQLTLRDWQWNDLQAFHHLVHSLTGSAGTFGLQSLSIASRQLEQQLKQMVDENKVPSESVWRDIKLELDHIEKLILNLPQMEAPTLDVSGVPDNPLELNEEPLVYLVEDDPEQAEHMALNLRDNGFKVKVFHDFTSFRKSISIIECPDAVVLDLILPEGESAGLELLAEMNTEQNCHAPVVCVSVRDDFETRLAAHKYGACHYLLKPVQSETLNDVLNTLTGRVTFEPYRVVLLDDDPLLLEAQSSVLKAAGMRVKALNQPNEILTALDSFQPDVLILDVYMPSINGPELAGIIREREEYLSLPILFLSAETDLHQQLNALKLGGDDFLVKPVQPSHLIGAVTARAKRARQYAQVQARLRNTLYEREREHLALNQHAIVSIADHKGDIVEINDKFCQISGYSRKELIGHNHRIIKSSEHPPEFYKTLWSTISRGKVWQGVICNRAKDGSLYWVESTITPFMDEAGKPYQYVSIRTDITHQLLSEQAIELAKERLRRGQTYANIGTWEWNIVSGELFWTEQIPPLFGYPKGDLETTYDNFLGALHPDDRQNLMDAVNNCIQKGGSLEVEHRVVWPDGTVRWLLSKGDVQRDVDDNPLKMIGVVQDIHVRKLAEQKLVIFGRVFDAAEQSIGVTDAEGYLIYSNPAHDRLLGYEPGECIGMNFRAFFTEKTQQEEVELMMASLSEGKSWSGILPVKLKNGIEVISYSNVGVIMDVDSKPKYLFNILVDYSDELARQAQLKKAKEEAEKANRAKSDFLASMSHELRTPLNSIIGFAQLLALSDLTDRQKDQISTIATSGQHLLSLINDVLEFAKLESGKLHLNIDSVEVRPIIEQVLALSEAHAYKNHIQIEVAPWSQAIYIKADPVRFKQVLLNLISNGIKYNRTHGKLSLSWQIIQNDQQPFWQLQVKDTGLGVAPQDLPRLFEPFDRLGYEGSSIEGSGIGLSITKDLVEQMGGWIEVASELEVGTTFSVYFPLDERNHDADLLQSSPMLIAEEASEPFASSAFSKTLKVLYVEDNVESMKLMAQIAQMIEGIELRIAPRAENGLQQAQDWLPQLILLDINLPGMNGDEALPIFKALPGYQRQTPIIYAVTANVLAHQVAHYKDLGFDKVIAKPFDLSEVIKQVEDIRDAAQK